MNLTIWLIIAAILIVAEIVTLGLTSIWFAGGAVVAGLVAYFGAHWIVQLLVFAAVSLVLFIFTRPVAVKHLMKNREKTNVESLVGQTGYVKQEINNLKACGVVILNGMEWTARSVDNSTIAVDTEVVVQEISGVKLMVARKAE